MVDNVSVTEGAGDKVIATDDVGGVQYQRIKLNWGPDGTANQADTASGKPLPVQLRGSAGGDVVKLEDDASANADPGVPILAVRKTTPANTSGADGDYEFLQMSSGRLWVSTVLEAGTNTNEVVGDAAHDGAAAGNPVLIGGYASAAAPSNVSADADAVRAWHLRNGAYAVNVTAAGALIGGDATNGLDVDVTRVPFSKAEDTASADSDVGVPAMAVRKATPADTSGNDGDYEMLQMSAGMLWTNAMGLGATCSTDIIRPADTTAYTANDAMSNSTSSPTSGGFTFTSAARKSGGSGIITDAIIVSSADTATTALQGEIWIFDTSVTNVNDNSAFAVNDTEVKTLVGVISFSLADTGNNHYAHVTGLNIMYTCSGSANLRFLVKVRNAWTPTSGEVLTFRIKCLYLD